MNFYRNFFLRLLPAWSSPNPPLTVRLARLLLLPISLLNHALQRIRIALYQAGVLKTYTLPATVISVGNLTMGGSGKTPAVALIAEILIRNGSGPAILSRGYGADRGGVSPIVVSDGESVLVGPDAAGDEPFFLAKALKGVPVVVGRDRVACGLKAIERFQRDALILDDGYQHVRLARDVNICLIDCEAKSVLEDFVFPSGMLRESASQLARADAFILTHWEETEENRALSLKLEKRHNKKIFRARHVPVSFLEAGGQETGLDHIRGKRVLPFCGIANPDSFLRHLTALGADITAFLPFPDHYTYSQGDLKSIFSKGEGSGAELLVTTEKDIARLGGRIDLSLPVWVLRIRMEVLEDALFRSLFDCGDAKNIL